MRGLVPRWGGWGGAWQNPRCQFAIPSHNSSFSYLGVPAPAGMSDWYENALRWLSSAPANRSIRHSGEGRNPEGWGWGNVVRGLVPRWGGWGGAWQNPRCQFAIPSHNSSFSYLGVPAPAGMSDWYENALKWLSIAPANRSIRNSGEGRNPEGWGEGNVVRSKTSRGEGLVPRWGRVREWLNPPRQLAVPNHNFGFSYLGVPATTGMSDWYENSRTANFL